MGIFNSKRTKVFQNNYLQIVCVASIIIFLSSFAAKKTSLPESILKDKTRLTSLNKTTTVSLLDSNHKNLNVKKALKSSAINTTAYTCGGVVGGTGPTDDFDGDGICNDVDVDDDNDGVLDTDEYRKQPVPVDCSNLNTNSPVVLDYSFENTPVYGSYSNYTGTAWVIDSNGGYESSIDHLNKSTYGATHGSQSLELGKTTKGNIYQDINVVLGEDYDVVFDYASTSGLVITFNLIIEDPVSNTILLSEQITTVSGNTLPGGIYGNGNASTHQSSVFTSTSNKIRLRFKQITSTNNGSAIDNIRVNGLASSVDYQNCTLDIDTDNDGIPNRLDLDSDGDGCPDAVEAGISTNLLTSATVSNGSGGTVTSTTSIANALVTGTTDANNNGLLDSVENGTTGTINYNSYYNIYAEENTVNSCLDSDADGLGDVIDLDDDNDGILDVEEQTYTSSILSNTGITVSSELTPWNGTSISDIVDGTTDNEFAFANASNVTNKEVIVFNLVTPEVLSSMVFQQNNTTEFIETRSSYKIQGSNNGVDWSDIKVSSVEEMNSNSLTFPFQHNKTAYLTYRLFIVSGNMSQGSYVKEVVLTKKVFADKDTDLDTIVDRLDLDADGDGCSDALEGGAVLTTANLTTSAMPGGNTGGSYTGSASPVTQNISGTVDANGVPTLVAGGQTKNWSQEASINESCIDTDGDLVNNEIDLDDDNDGILDAEECSGQNFTLDLGVFDDGVDDRANKGETKIKTKPLIGAGTGKNVTLTMVHNGTWGEIEAKASGGHWNGQDPSGDRSLIHFYNLDITNEHESYIEFQFDVPVYNLNFYYADIDNGGYTGPEKTIIEGSHNGTIHAPITTNFDENHFPQILGTNKNVYEGLNATSSNVIKINFKQPVTILKIKVMATTANPLKVYQSLFNLNYSFCRDTDLDLIPDSLDLDSDNDGCADAVEGGGYVTTSNLVTDTNMPGSVKTNLGTTVNANGIPVIAGVGQTIGDSQDNNKTSYCTDTDSDGINNYNDLDDDNDGILDFSEMTFFNSDRKTGNYNTNEGEKDVRLNYDFSGYDYSQGQDFDDVIASASNISATNLDISIPGFSSHSNIRNISATTLIEAKENLDFLGFNFTTTTTFEVATIDWISHYSIFGDNGAYKFTVSISEDNGVSFTDIAEFVETNNSSSYNVNKNILDFIIKPGAFYQVRLYFYEVTPRPGRDFIDFDDFQLIFDYYQTRNSDFDSLSNHVDLDADDDGCADAIEGGGGFSNGVLVESTIPVGGTNVKDNLGNAVDANGVPTIAVGGQTTGHSQNATFSSFCTDTDTDGVNDFIDIDDDNDGIIDKLESDCEDSGKGPNNTDTNLGANIKLSYYFGTSNNEGVSLTNTTNYISTTTDIDNTDKINTNYGTWNNSVAIRDVEAITLQEAKTNNEYMFFEFSTGSGFYEGSVDWVSMWNPKETSGKYNATVSISSDGGKTFTDLTTFTEASGDGTGNFPVGKNNVDIPNYQILPSFTYIVRIYFYDLVPDSGNNYILFDDLELVFDFCKNINTDVSSDAYPNRLDLDSDGDGCPDAIESAVPSALVDSGVNNINGISINTPNSKIDTALDPVGVNGFANSLETNDTALGTLTDAYVPTNYTNYALVNSKNGCGVPMLTQVYLEGTTQKILEVTNMAGAGKVVVPNGFHINIFNPSNTTNRVASYTNASEISANTISLFSQGSAVGINKDNLATFTQVVALSNISTTNNTVSLSRSGKPNNDVAWNSRFETLSNIETNTSYVRKDFSIKPAKVYDSNYWVAYVADGLSTLHDDYERHPHAPLLSEVKGSVDAESNILLGAHKFGPTTRTGAAWSNGTPDRSRKVIVSENYSVTSKFQARTLEVTGASNFVVNNALLVVSDTLNIKDSSGAIRLVSSDNANRSQLVQTHESASRVLGSGKLMIDQNSTVPSLYRYNYFSSPVHSSGTSTFTLADVLKDGTIALTATSSLTNIDFVSGYNGETGTPIKLANYWIYTFGSGGAWSSKGSTGAISVGDGFTLKGPGAAQNYTFAGSANDGEITRTVGANTSYLVGNPYPSAISAKKFIQDNPSLSGTLYFWQHTGESDTSGTTSGHNIGGYIGGYATYNLSASVAANAVSTNSDMVTAGATGAGYNAPGDYIGIGQGFFVSGNNTTGGTITFNNSQRLYKEEGATSIFFKTAATKNTKKTVTPEISVIKLGMDYHKDGLVLHRQLAVSFYPGNSFGYERGYDSELYDIGTTDLYWKFPEDARNYVITGVEPIHDALEVPLELVVDYTGEVRILLDEVTGVNQTIYLLDKETDETTNISDAQAVLYLTPGTYSDRFALTFTPRGSSLSVDENVFNEHLELYSNERQLFLNVKGNVNATKLELFSLLGKQVANFQIEEGKDKHSFEIHKTISTGIYIVRVATNTGILNKKVFIK